MHCLGAQIFVQQIFDLMGCPFANDKCILVRMKCLHLCLVNQFEHWQSQGAVELRPLDAKIEELLGASKPCAPLQRWLDGVHSLYRGLYVLTSFRTTGV